MDAQEKLEILADAGRYDLACACGTKNPEEHRQRDGLGKWLYPVSLPSGGSGIMLKTLLSSSCAGDCGYCPLRAGMDTVRRCTMGADEMARIFLDYQRRHRLIGLFLSSGIIRDADHTMQRLNAVAAILRRKYRYRGYIHLKVIPGASDAAIEETVSLASAVSINIETPSAEHCARLSERKNWRQDIMRPMESIRRFIEAMPPKRRVRQTTQFIVGAADETDRDIVGKTFDLYTDLKLKRVYFSAYQRGAGRSAIPGEQIFDDGILTREHRLYQTDFLIRQYGFSRDDMVFDEAGKLSLADDPKKTWADAHPEFFPLNVGKAERWQLLRVPGLGPITVNRIIKERREDRVQDLAAVKVTGKRATLAASYLDFS
jgi:Predicted DNA-binding protein with the Helix-hairpin-helix motif